MFAWIKRAWRSKGHGVHSPFAYDFIANVLTDKHPYYAYDFITETIEGEGLNSGNNLNLAKLLYRTIIYLKPLYVSSIGINTPHFRLITDRAEEDLGSRRCNTPMYFVAGRPEGLLFDEETARKFPTDGFFAVIDNNDESVQTLDRVTGIIDSLGFGMTFRSAKGVTVAVALPHLPRQDFNLNF